MTESQVQESLEKIQLSQAELVPIFEDRPAQMGDTAQLDFEGFVDGEPLEGAKAERYKLELGSGQFIEGFEEGLVGMRPGSTTELNLSFPSEYQNSQLAGQPVKFKVSLLGLEKKLLPAIDDELAKKEGAFENLQDLKEHIRKQLVEEENQNQMSEMRNKILKALVEENPVEVPRSLHQRQKELIVEDVRKRMSQQGLSELDFEEYKKKWSEDFDQSATFIVQSSFLVDALADKLSLRPTHDELHEKISEIARQTGLSESLLSDYYHKPENESRLSFQLMEEKVVACLVEKANIVEVQKPPELS
ncbi:MAG: trigger factor [Bdellovibrionales bacterium]|nr:trigger factor [Bdellovibrionales bacterium]